MDATIYNGYYSGCFFDVCSFENSGMQKSQLCSTVQRFNDECVTLGLTLGSSWSFDWRTKFGCSKLLKLDYFDFSNNKSTTETLNFSFNPSQ